MTIENRFDSDLEGVLVSRLSVDGYVGPLLFKGKTFAHSAVALHVIA